MPALERIHWHPSYATGEDRVDEQHRKLFEYMNELAETIEESEKGKLDEAAYLKRARHVVDFLGNYARTHFDYEEVCMERYSCPIASQNKDAHSKFIDVHKQYLAKMEKLKNPNDILFLLREVHKVIFSWIDQHIRRIDTRLEPCIHRQ